ncbi:MAG: FAD-dependent oxidoreductase [Gammaproteobacteria bacterium]|nr:FAD-dependent oxidoreductase [Gammaproteobacteria bacterium]
MEEITDLDIAIFGAGIAGLWTLARLQQAGYRVALFERDALGGIQSIASQGIIHGGTKYALTGRLTGSAMAIGEMPGIWRAALAGDGEIDLRDVRILSPHQYLWTTGSLSSGMAGFFAGKVMHSRMQPLERGAYPPPFDDPAFRGQVYRLDEPVLDPRSLIQVLGERCAGSCHRVAGIPDFARDDDGWRCALPAGPVVRARHVVLAAGRGNAQLLAALGHDTPRMQTRPLHMLMLRGALPMLHAHCLGASANPRLTVTSYPLEHGQVVWYLGGQVAEEGSGRDRDAQIRAGRDELAALLPWLRNDDAQWATLEIDRAEIATPGGRRPDDAYVGSRDGVITCWPTKLAFAPRVARLVGDAIAADGVAPAGRDGPAIDLPPPPLASLPWDGELAWS